MLLVPFPEVMVKPGGRFHTYDSALATLVTVYTMPETGGHMEVPVGLVIELVATLPGGL
jgi:hypothetical protein